MYTIGEELRSRRKKRGYTLSEVASLIGVSDHYLHKLETGAASCGYLQRLHAVAFVYGVSPFRLLNALWLDATGTSLKMPRNRSPFSSKQRNKS